MDLQTIRNAHLQSKSKKEIMSFLANVLTDFDLAVEYELLREFLTPEQFAIIEQAVEKDTREAIQENNPDMEESDILEWVEADKYQRPLGFRNTEDGKFMITDLDSRMQENPNIVDIDLGNFNVAYFTELVLQGIKYKQTHLEYRETFPTELTELQTHLKNFSTQLRDLDSIKRRTRVGDKSTNLLLEVMRLTHTTLSVDELEALVSTNAASMAKMLLKAEAEQMYKPNPRFSEETIEQLKQDHIAHKVYAVGINQRTNTFELSPLSSFLPQLDLDFEKMDSPAFNQTLLTALEQNKDRLGNQPDGFIWDELKEIMQYTLSPERPRDIDSKTVKSAATIFAKDPNVIGEMANASQALHTLNELDQQNKDTNQFDFDK